MKPNQTEQSLISQLQTFPETPDAKTHMKLTASAFVLRYGYLYKPSKLSKDFSKGTVQECFANATKLLMQEKQLVYCEGFAISKGCPLPTRHAWVTDGKGRAFDSTWKRGIAYAGVPLKTDYVVSLALKYRAIVSMIDDWEHGWPLLRELAESPEKWLAQSGAGYFALVEGTTTYQGTGRS